MRDRHRHGHRHRHRHRRPTIDERHSVAGQSHRIVKKRKFTAEQHETLTLTRVSIQSKSDTEPVPSRKNIKRRKRKSASPFGSRKWVYADTNCDRFTDKLLVISYNVLGVENASKHPDLYYDVPLKYMDWDYRKELIHEEITRYQPSILCFQEVDRFGDLDDILQRDGFRGVFKARSGDACDGCAIFWKDERFTLLHEEDIEFQNFGLRNNIAQFCVLEMNGIQLNSDQNSSKSEGSTARNLIIGNIHVLFNPNRGDIKLGQVRLFLEKAYKLSKEWGTIPVILAGDLNSIPQSALYQFVSSAKLDILLHDRRRISGQVDIPLHSRTSRFQNCHFSSRPFVSGWSDEELKFATGQEHVTSLQHHLKLQSAYLGVPGSSRTRDALGEPLATSCHSKFTGSVDYIWHTEELIPVRVLETLPLDVLRRIGGLPNEKWGSDHLALVCEFAFADSGNSN